MKAVFFDIDGTIISDDDNRYIPQSTKDTIKALRNNDCMTFINTGRVFCNVNPYVKELGFDGYACGCGTNIIVDGKDILYHKTDRSRCLDIAYYLRSIGYEPLYERKDGVFFDFKLSTVGRSERLRKFFTLEGRDTSRGIEHPDFSFDKFICWIDDTPNREKLVEYLKPDFECIFRSDGSGKFFEVVPTGYSKATAIEVVAKQYNISYNDLYVIGDGENDVPMFKAVKNSIALKGNSNIYEYVSYVTDTIYNDGVKKAMEHFKLI